MRECALERPSPAREPLAGSDSSDASLHCGHGSHGFRTGGRARKHHTPSTLLETLLELFYLCQFSISSLGGARLAVGTLGQLGDPSFEDPLVRAIDHQAVVAHKTHFVIVNGHHQ